MNPGAWELRALDLFIYLCAWQKLVSTGFSILTPGVQSRLVSAWTQCGGTESEG